MHHRMSQRAAAAIRSAFRSACELLAKGPLTTAYHSDITLIDDRLAGTTAEGGIPMNGPSDKSAARRLRDWWLTPPRPGLQRLIHPWEFRRLRRFAALRIVGGCVAAVVGIVCLSYAAYGWAAFFLIVAALDLACGYWFLTIARTRSA
jgi:hypothetical protein